MKPFSLFRFLVCFLLICCMVVNVSPLRANAMSAALPAFFAANAIPVLGAILVGLGIYWVAESDAFQNLVYEMQRYIPGSSAESLEDQKCEIIKFVPPDYSQDPDDGSDNKPMYYVPEELIENVFDGVYESGAVSHTEGEPDILPAGTKFKVGNYTNVDFPVDVKVFVFYPSEGASSAYVYFVSTEPFDSYNEVWYSGSPSYVRNPDVISYNDIEYYCAFKAVETRFVSAYKGVVCESGYYDFIGGVLAGELTYGESETTVADGLAAGQIAAQGTSIADGYPEWAANSVTYADSAGNVSRYYPICLTDTLEELMSKTQEDAWAGNSDYTETVLSNWEQLLQNLSAVKSAILTLPSSIGSFFENLDEKLEIFFGGISEIITSILEELQNSTNKVTEILKWLFEYNKADFVEQFNGLRDRVPIVDTMVDFATNTASIFYGIGTKPPIIYIDLAAAEGDVDWGERVVFLDLTWYERYKPYGDAVISSFLWAWFGWRLLHTIPGMLNGSAGVVPRVRIGKDDDYD